MSDNEANDPQQDQEPVVEEEPKNILKQETVSQSLTQITKTFDGSSYAFTNLNLEGKEIEELGDVFGFYPHLRYINLSNNKLKVITDVNKIPHVLQLNASANQIDNLNVFSAGNTLTFLQIVNLSNNKLKELVSIPQKDLFHLNLSQNEIVTCENFTGHPKLRLLELRTNKLTKLIGLRNMPQLRELYIGENEVTSLEGLEDLPLLERLHLRKNNISTLDAIPDLPSLVYLNLRENNIATLDEIRKLSTLRKLKKLNLLSNPITEEVGGAFKKEVLMLLDMIHFSHINKDEVTEDDVTEAKTEKQERINAEIEAAAQAKREAEEAALNKENEGGEGDEQNDEN